MAKVTEKTVRTNTLNANQNSKHLLVGLQSDKGSKFYTVNVVARKTGAVVQTFPELSASEANEAITMFELCARVTALQINGLAEALDSTLVELVSCIENEASYPDASNDSATVLQAREALAKFRGRA